MDKLLAMSIMSAGPSAAPGTRPSMTNRRRNDEGKEQQGNTMENGKEGKCTGAERRPAAEKPEGEKSAASRGPLFAPEFDGLNFFETLVSR